LKNSIRVLHICGSITTSGGVGTFLMNYYKDIDRKKIQFDFVSHNETEQSLVEEINRMGGNVYKVTPKSESFVKNIIEMFKMINKKSVHDVIHIHTASTTSFLYLLAAKLAGKRVRIIHSHGTDLEKPKGSFQHRIHKMLRSLVLFLATDLFACSKAAGEWMYGQKNIDKVTVINNAVDAKKFKYNEANVLKIKKRMSLEEKFVIGNIGRFSYPKNHHFMIEIFNEIIKIKPSIVLLLIGDGEAFDEIKQIVRNLGLDNYVQFLGIRKDIPELLQAMDVFLLPSRFEGLPVVLIEAQASGIKIFATDTITKEVEITDLVTWLPINESPEYWAKKIIEQSNNLERKNTYQQIVDSGYDIKSNAKWLEKFYLNRTN